MICYQRGVGLFLFFITIFASSQSLAIDFSKLIKEIRITGVSRADSNTIRYYIHSKTGEKYNANTSSGDMRRVYDLGFFDDVKIDVQEEEDGLVLTYIFKEKPFVREVILTNVEEVEKSEITAKLKTQKGTFFRQDQTPWDQKRIKQIYRNKGFYFSQIKTVVHKLNGNQVDVEYIVDEGRKIIIKEVKFRVAKAFSGRTLQNNIETKEGGWTSVFADSGAYKKDTLKTDLLRLESFYHDNGYLKVKVFDPEVEVNREKRNITVTFPLDEGDQYRVGKIEAQGDEVYSEKELLDRISLEEGDIFNKSLFRKDVFGITDMYSQKGYAFARVIPKLNINDEEKIVNIWITINRGRKVYVGKIKITGNDNTRDRVIRREFRLGEGELFNSAKLRRTRQRINNLGFFESVDIEQRSRPEEDLVDFEVKVVERSTGQISFAMGYSSFENLILQGQVKWNNLMGRGQELSMTLDYSDLRSDFTLRFTEPALFDRQLLGGVDMYNKTYRYTSYDSKNTGAGFRIGRDLGEYLFARLGYKYERNKVLIIDDERASVFLREQEGISTVGSLNPSLTYDTRNDPYSPTSGQKIYVYAEMGGIGGNEKYYKLIGEHTYYKSLLLGFVSMTHLKIGRAEGYGGKGLPIFKRFYLGGPRSLRGFTYEDIGPQDEFGDTIGGEALLQLNAELQYRFTRYFRGFLFYDRGNVYGTNDAAGNTTDKYYDLGEMRHSWGFGVHFFSPVGPITLAYGFKLDQRPGESPSEFHFTIGGAF